MKKFGAIYKEQQSRFDELKEGKVLDDFKKIYSSLLEKYEVTEFYNLTEAHQSTFLNELNGYWTEETGLTEKGFKFLNETSELLAENATTGQKKKYLQKKATTIISEQLRQGNFKWKIYGVVEEMFKQIKATNISEVLSPDEMLESIFEAFSGSLDEFMHEIGYELHESAKPEKKT